MERQPRHRLERLATRYRDIPLRPFSNQIPCLGPTTGKPARHVMEHVTNLVEHQVIPLPVGLPAPPLYVYVVTRPPPLYVYVVTRRRRDWATAQELRCDFAAGHASKPEGILPKPSTHFGYVEAPKCTQPHSQYPTWLGAYLYGFMLNQLAASGRENNLVVAPRARTRTSIRR